MQYNFFSVMDILYCSDLLTLDLTNFYNLIIKIYKGNPDMNVI